MSTGDIKGNITHLQRCLQHVKYPSTVDEIGLTLGDPLAALPILNFVLLKYSRHVASYILRQGIQLQGKTDEGFVKNVFRLFRDHLGLRVIITPAQFLEQGYAERKVLLLIDAVRAVRAIHQAGVKQERAKIENAWRQSPRKQQQSPASPVVPVVQLRGGQQHAEHLQQVHVTAATDAAHAIYELIQPEEQDFTAAAITALTSPARSRTSVVVKHQLVNSDDSNPLGYPQMQTGSSSSGSSVSRHVPERQYRSSDGDQQQQNVDCSSLQPRILQPMPVQQQQQQEGNGSHRSNCPGASSCSEQLIAAGLMPLPRSPSKYCQQQHQQQQQLMEDNTREQMAPATSLPQPAEPAAVQQQQRRPLRSCLWPQSQPLPEQSQQYSQACQGLQQGIIDGNANSSSSNSSSMMPQQFEEEELLGTTTLIQTPGSPVVDKDGDVAAEDDKGGQMATLQQPSDAAGVNRVNDLTLEQQQQQQQLMEIQSVVTDLQHRLTLAEQQLEKQRAAAARFEESASARITLLEGRLKFLQNMVTSNQRPQQHGTGGLPDNMYRGRESSAAHAAVQHSMAYPPASHFTARSSPPVSPDSKCFMSDIPRPSPARSAAAAVAGGSTDWRTAASAAAAAVVAGLTGSPFKSPLKPKTAPGNMGASVDPMQQAVSRVWHFRPQDHGLHSSTNHTDDRAAHEQHEREGADAATMHALQAKHVHSFNAKHMARRSADVLDRAKVAPAVAQPDGNHGLCIRTVDLAANKENRDTGVLIDKLASRAVEAAAMLEAFRTGRMV